MYKIKVYRYNSLGCNGISTLIDTRGDMTVAFPVSGRVSGVRQSPIIDDELGWLSAKTLPCFSDKKISIKLNFGF